MFLNLKLSVYYTTHKMMRRFLKTKGRLYITVGVSEPKKIPKIDCATLIQSLHFTNESPKPKQATRPGQCTTVKLEETFITLNFTYFLDDDWQLQANSQPYCKE